MLRAGQSQLHPCDSAVANRFPAPHAPNRCSVQIWGTGVRVEVVLRTLGLASAADTMVGSATVRGVSGGERKRVTSAEMLVAPHAESSMSTVLGPVKSLS